MESRNIMIVGVGGQGTLLASKLLGRILLENGYDVKVSEVHGMSQRGGSVVTYVRYGEKVYSPIIDKGEADIIISFELLEAARWVEYLKEGGILLTNTQRINPMPVITGAAEYPKSLEQKLATLPIQLDAMDALGLALQERPGKIPRTQPKGLRPRRRSLITRRTHGPVLSERNRMCESGADQGLAG